jgi:hypothetical protein
VISESSTSTNGCWRLNADPRSYLSETIRSIIVRLSFPSVLYSWRQRLLLFWSPLRRIDPVVDDQPTDEGGYLAGPIIAMEHQSIAIMRTVVDCKLFEGHWGSPVGDRRAALLKRFAVIHGLESMRDECRRPTARWTPLRTRDNARQERRAPGSVTILGQQQVTALFSFAHAGVQACHREPHSAMNYGLSNRRYSQRIPACETGS